jgi:DNA-binding SARP family transcriptional activator
VSTLPTVELGVLGPLRVQQHGAPVNIPGAKPRALLTMLGLHNGSVVAADTLIELLWGADPPRTAAKALQTHISALRRTLGDGFVLTEGAGWRLADTSEVVVDASRYKSAARHGRNAAAAGDTGQAVAHFEEALGLWRGIPELPDGRRGLSEKTRWIEGHAALVEDRADALLATGRAAEVIGDLEAAVADAPLRERRWGQLMLALYRAGRQGEALAAYQRARSLLADELGVDPGPELRRLEGAIVAQDASLETPVAQHLPAVTRAVTFLLTDIEGSTAAWEAEADAMAGALARHDELVEQVVTSRGGRLIKTRGEGDATFSVFERPSAAAAAAIELQDAIGHEPWALREPMRIRVALHTGEVELRDGDYFGRAVNRAARLRSLALGGQILCSGAVAELVIDSLPDDIVLADLGMRQLRNLSRPEHVFELRLEAAKDVRDAPTSDAPIERPALPAVLIGPGPFVGRGPELERLSSAWQTRDTHAVLIAGEPGVGKTRLAGEWSHRAYQQGAVVLYGRCDEDLGAPYQPFAEALRSLVPCVGADRLRGLRGVEGLLPLVPGLPDVVPDLASPTRADPDTERYALFDAVVALLEIASSGTPIVLILDDLHWAAKPTLLLLRHLLRFGDHARVQIVGTYRSTDLDRSHPLAAMLADLHRDGTANRLHLGGLDEDDVTAYVAEAGYDDEELAHALASVTGGNPFFLIEALRHVDESGGVWDQSTLPQGVREAVSRRLTRLSADTNKALSAAAVVGSRFGLELIETVIGSDLIDAFDEACKAGIVIEEPGGRYRFNHAIVRQSLLAELASVRRMRLHQRIATTLETQPGADDELLAELAHHYFECAWAGNAVKAVEYCRRAADQAMARLAYEGAADLYDHAVHALEEIDDELPDRDEQTAELMVARCEALLAAGDVASASGAVSQLQEATVDSARLAAWATCFDGQLSMLIRPDRLDEVEVALGAAAEKLAELDDAAGQAMAHTVRAACLGRLGRIGDCEVALDDALTAARRAREHRRVNAVLAGAPLAALWGPSPVPRAGGRCLDVVRLLRITTDSPAVEATSTRCQAVLEAFRGRAPAARRMIDSARRTVTELGLRHALLEVEQFAGIVELVADDPAAAEPHLRQAYNGFRRMGLDADTAETAALLGRTCLALGREAEADELCTESEHLAGHALKASIAWRTLRAQLLARRDEHREARRVAEAAVGLAERTDALVDHGDACLTLAIVLDAAREAKGARAAAERAVGLYERKGAAALAEKARGLLGVRDLPAAPAEPEVPIVELDNACVRAIRRAEAAVDREAWDEVEDLLATDVSIESRRKMVGFTRDDVSPGETIRLLENGGLRFRIVVIAVRGERLALARLEIGTADVSPGAPRDELLQLFGLDENGRIALQVAFDIEDMDAALAELDAAHARLDEVQPRAPLENAASRADHRFNALFAGRRWDDIGALLTDDIRVEDRRRGLRREGNDRATELAELRAIADVGVKTMTSHVLAIRGERLALVRTVYSGRDQRPEAFHTEVLRIAEIDADERIVAYVAFDPDDLGGALEELDARYIAGEAAPSARTWSVIANGFAALNRRELPPTTPNWVNTDHRRGTSIAPGEMPALLDVAWNLTSDLSSFIVAVHRLDDLGAVVTHVTNETSHEGFHAEWRVISLLTLKGDLVNRCEVFDEADLDAALARFDELNRPAPRLENAASRVTERFLSHFAAGDWDAIAERLADDFSQDDRRRVVGAGVRHGRDAQIVDMHAIASLRITELTSTVMATRGERLVLVRCRFAFRDQGPEAFLGELLGIAEINADERIVAAVSFDLDDMDAAFEELDARYLAGEAAAHSHTWSLITGAFAAINRHELPELKPDWVNIDHRRGAAFAAGEMTAYLHDLLDDTPDINVYIEVVNRLNNLGAVVTQAAHGSSQQGFQAEWREIGIFTFDGDLLGRYELFDEADLDSALAKFEQLSRSAPRLANSATQVADRVMAHFTAREWDAATEMLADDFCSDDRRRTVNAGLRRGRDAAMKDAHANADLGATEVTSTVIATRGDRLVLRRARYATSAKRPEAFYVDALNIYEINGDGRLAAAVVFDIDDMDAALEELDARYLAGEAAAYSHSWSVITRGYAAFNRHEFPAPDWVNVDHRRARAFAPGELTAYMHATWDLAPNVRAYVEAVHRLNNLGAVVTHVVRGTSRQDFDAEWREVILFTIEGDLLNRCELFDEADLDAALARFAELQPRAPQLENAASQVVERFLAHFAAGNWDAAAEILADDFSGDDRRPVVGAGVRHGRDAEILDLRAIAGLWNPTVTSTVMATRGGRLVLLRAGFSSRDQGPEGFLTELLGIAEINSDNRMAAYVAFDLEDFEAAMAELDARYLAGEAAAYAATWSVITNCFATLSRHELPSTTPDLVDIDHRRGAAFAPGELLRYLHAGWEVNQSTRAYVEVVHRLSNLGAVVTHAADLTSREGFEAQWRAIDILTVEGELINRCEVFDEADLDTALTKFEELSRPTPRVENAASRVTERSRAFLAARDWDPMTEILAEDFCSDDRRRVVNTGIRHGRVVGVEDLRAAVDIVGIMYLTSVVIATRGDRLELISARVGNDKNPEAFLFDVLQVTEIDADERIAAVVTFDVGDVDAAFQELDARYLAGEAAAYANTWSVIAQAYASINRGVVPAAAQDWVHVDHRLRATIGADDLIAYLRAAWDLTPNLSIYVQEVHRLSDLGTVVTHASHGSSREGFDVEWRMIELLTVEGDRIRRCEIFDEADLDAALARFEQLQPQAPRLENEASQVAERLLAHFAAGDWDAVAEMLADDFSSDDRRRVVGAGVRHGQDAQIADMRAIADLWVTNVTTTTHVATRGRRLVLSRVRFSDRDHGPEAFVTEVLGIVEINADEQVVSVVSLEANDINAAFAELDARYLAGEACAYSHAWSVITRGYAAFNRHEFPAPDWVNIDHRRARAFAPGELTAYMHATWDLAPNVRVYVEAAHRLSTLGAVVTHVVRGTSREGFDAEWREVVLLTVEGDLLNRCEVFDEADLDAALARFEELLPQARRLENAASRADDRFFACYGAGNWAAVAEILADDSFVDDRRRVVNAGFWGGRDGVIANMRALEEGGANITWTVIAIRGERLALTRICSSNRNPRHGEFGVEMLGIAEIDTDERIAAHVVFDLDDIDAAFAELDARYLAGEAAPHARTWSVIMQGFASLNRRELPPTTPDWVNIDHRRATAFAPGDANEYIRAAWDLTKNLDSYVEDVHRLSDLGAVVAHAGRGTSLEGFHAEWGLVSVFTVEGDLVSRAEMFDEADIDAALAHFEELQPQAPRLENVASRMIERYQACFAARDWAALAELLADDIIVDDRRHVVNAGVRHGRDVHVADLQAAAEVGAETISSTAIATRGERLALTRVRTFNRGLTPGEFGAEMLGIGDLDADDRMTALVSFDIDDIDAAFEELDARYLAGEAAAHAHTWSVIARNCAAFNRHELPTTDWVTIDHRRLAPIDASDLQAAIRAVWDLTPDLGTHIEVVHRLSSFGAVVTYSAKGTSLDGLDAEWRMIELLAVEGDRISRCEWFDEADLDTALARFDELERPAASA